MELIEIQLEKIFKDAIKKYSDDFSDWDKLFFQKTSNPKFGDFQTNFAMVNSKFFKTQPRKIAEEIVELIDKNNVINNIEIAGPGFINIYLNNKYLEHFVDNGNPTCFDFSHIDNGGDVVIDYSSPNIAKRMHIGHLRSTVIGDSIKRIYRYLGYHVIADNHIGDWGTQYGKLIVGYNKWLDKEEYRKNPIAELERIYVKFSHEVEQNPELEDLARQELKKLQDGDEFNTQLWKEFIEVSMNEYQKTYKRLDIEFDTVYGESFYHDMMPEVVETLKEKGIAQIDDGAVVVFFDEKENLHPCIVQKNDGAFLYASSDLATLKFKMDTYNLNQTIYVTDERQQTHFKQVFKISEMLGWDIKKVHIWFGIMRFTDSIFSSRKGNVIRLEELLDEAVKRVRLVIDEKNPDLSQEEKSKIAEVVGVGAIKYSDLSQNRQSTVIFDWEKMLSFEGNTSPYLQYTYARIKSILRKAKGKGITKSEHFEITSEQERQLIINLLYFPSEVIKSSQSYKPNIITEYLFELAQKFNSYYNSTPILKNDNLNEVRSRLALISRIADFIKEGLYLLGIGVVERI